MGGDLRRDDLVPIHGPLYIVTDDVVHPVCRDEKDPDCRLITRCYLQRLVLSQRVRYLREGLLGFLQAFIDSIHHTSEGGGLINTRSGTGSVGATRGGALHRSFLVRLLARLDQPYHHAIGHAHYPPVASCTTVTIARIRGELGRCSIKRGLLEPEKTPSGTVWKIAGGLVERGFWQQSGLIELVGPDLPARPLA